MASSSLLYDMAIIVSGSRRYVCEMSDEQPRNPIALAFGGVVRELRLSKGMSQAQLAYEAGLSQPYLSQLETVTAIRRSRRCLRVARARDLATRAGRSP